MSDTRDESQVLAIAVPDKEDDEENPDVNGPADDDSLAPERTWRDGTWAQCVSSILLGKYGNQNAMIHFNERWVKDFDVTADDRPALRYGIIVSAYVALALFIRDVATSFAVTNDHVACRVLSNSYYWWSLAVSLSMWLLGFWAWRVQAQLTEARRDIRLYLYRDAFKPNDALAVAYATAEKNRHILGEEKFSKIRKKRHSEISTLVVARVQMTKKVLNGVIKNIDEYRTELEQLKQNMLTLIDNMQSSDDATKNSKDDDPSDNPYIKDVIREAELLCQRNERESHESRVNNQPQSVLLNEANLQRSCLFRIIFPVWIFLAIAYSIWVQYGYDEITYPEHFFMNHHDTPLSGRAPFQPAINFTIGMVRSCGATLQEAPFVDRAMMQYCDPFVHGQTCSSTQTSLALITFCRHNERFFIESLTHILVALLLLAYFWQGLDAYAGVDCLTQLWQVGKFAVGNNNVAGTRMLAETNPILDDTINLYQRSLRNNAAIKSANIERDQVSYVYEALTLISIASDFVFWILCLVYVGEFAGTNGDDRDAVQHVSQSWLVAICTIAFTVGFVGQGGLRFGLSFLSRLRVFMLYNRIPDKNQRRRMITWDFAYSCIKLISGSVLTAFVFSRHTVHRSVHKLSPDGMAYTLLIWWFFLVIILQSLVDFCGEKQDQTSLRTEALFNAQTVPFEDMAWDKIGIDSDSSFTITGIDDPVQKRRKMKMDQNAFTPSSVFQQTMPRSTMHFENTRPPMNPTSNKFKRASSQFKRIGNFIRHNGFRY